MKRHPFVYARDWELNDRDVQCIHRLSGDIGTVIVDWLAVKTKPLVGGQAPFH